MSKLFRLKHRQQIEREIREAMIFLRKHNHTIPDTTLAYIKQAALNQLDNDWAVATATEKIRNYLNKIKQLSETGGKNHGGGAG